MIRASFQHVQIATIAFASLLSSGAAAQSVVDPARRLTRQQIELAAASYVGQTLVAESGRNPAFASKLAFDQRSTDYRHRFDEDSPRPMREVQHSGRLAQALGAQLTDGQGAIKCTAAGGTSCRYNIGRGLLRMSVPRVHNDSARVAVDLVAPTEDSGHTYRTAWDLLLVKNVGTWVVVPQRHARVSY